ncbi:hypothetical protein, partial [Sphingomonas sanguinis]
GEATSGLRPASASPHTSSTMSLTLQLRCRCASTVVAFEAPLLKVVAHGMETIFNTASPSFVSAEKQLTSEEEMERWKDLPDYLRPETPPAG